MRITEEEAIKKLVANKIVAIPTETVYGLAAKVDSIEAIKAIFSLKQRPLDHPLIVHIAIKEDIYRLSSEQPSYLTALMDRFWPGPLTIILKKSQHIDPAITANQDTVAIRMPNHKLALHIIKSVGIPLVAPSANKFCQTSPTCAAHVEESLGQDVHVVDGGSCHIGIESTIIDATDEKKITLLRPGIITAEQIANCAGIDCCQQLKTAQKFSGSHKKHYAPLKPIIVLDDIAQLDNMPYSYCLLQSSYLHMSKHYVVDMPDTANDYAAMLYQHWHLASTMNVNNIIIERPPYTPEWRGIHDRINKAAYQDD